MNEASGWTDQHSGTVSDMHSYPGPGMRPVEEDRVVVLGEFGGLGMPVSGHSWQAEKNWGYVSYKTAEELTEAYVNLLTRMRPLIGRGLSAAVYTQTSDVEIEVNGLMTYDRDVVKMDLKRIAAPPTSCICRHRSSRRWCRHRRVSRKRGNTRSRNRRQLGSRQISRIPIGNRGPVVSAPRAPRGLP